MEYIYIPDGVCSQKFIININGDVLESIQIIGGCPGNIMALSLLIKGKKIDDIISMLKGIPCRNKGTSCPDQIAKALEKIKLHKKK